MTALGLALVLTGQTAASANGVDLFPMADGIAVPMGTTQEIAYENEFLQLINDERAAEGLNALAVYDDLLDDARAQAEAIRDAGYLFHNPDLANVTTGWYALGENVGYGPTVQLLHDAFMASPGHKANIMKPEYNYAAAGVVIDENDVIWVAVVFMHGPEGLPGSYPVDGATDDFNPPFRDDDDSVHEGSINAIADFGITAGCDAEAALYCPDDAVTRAQMATFLLRALDLTPGTTDHFSDDNGTSHEGAINAMADNGITLGCGSRMYCPNDTVTRGQMATFLARALDLPAAPTDYFDDDNGSPHEASINALAYAGVTGGCENRTYCPEAEVTRAQMATFLARALGLN